MKKVETKVRKKIENIFGNYFSCGQIFFIAKKKWGGFQTQKSHFNRFPSQ